MMIDLLILAAAQTVQPVLMPTDFRGRWACEVATRRGEMSEFEIWIRDGTASTSGNEAAKLPEVRDAQVKVGEPVVQDDMSFQPMQFRSGAVLVELKVYKRARFFNWIYLTVMSDPDENNALPQETATGFCVPVAPSMGGAQ